MKHTYIAVAISMALMGCNQPKETTEEQVQVAILNQKVAQSINDHPSEWKFIGFRSELLSNESKDISVSMFRNETDSYIHVDGVLYDGTDELVEAFKNHPDSGFKEKVTIEEAIARF